MVAFSKHSKFKQVLVFHDHEDKIGNSVCSSCDISNNYCSCDYVGSQCFAAEKSQRQRKVK